MSGIAGIVHFQGAPPDRDQVHQLSAGVAHRGTDDKALIYAPPAAFAHRTFAIQGSGTPARLEDERFIILVDGEADCHRIGRDWPARGALCLPHQSGGFATAVWDRMENALWLARDPCGTRPLFYARDGDKFAFSSCMRALLGIPWISAEIAIDNLAEYLSFRYTHAPRTLVRDIQAVPPGHVVRIDADGMRTERCWTLGKNSFSTH